MYTTGDASGCACESTSCPTGDQELQCSDPSCKGGNDNKCTVDDQGCDCAEDPECPIGLDTLACHECGDADQESKCKGVSRYLSPPENDFWLRSSMIAIRSEQQMDRLRLCRPCG